MRNVHKTHSLFTTRYHNRPGQTTKPSQFTVQCIWMGSVCAINLRHFPKLYPFAGKQKSQEISEPQCLDPNRQSWERSLQNRGSNCNKKDLRTAGTRQEREEREGREEGEGREEREGREEGSSDSWWLTRQQGDRISTTTGSVETSGNREREIWVKGRRGRVTLWQSWWGLKKVYLKLKRKTFPVVVRCISRCKSCHVLVVVYIFVCCLRQIH